MSYETNSFNRSSDLLGIQIDPLSLFYCKFSFFFINPLFYFLHSYYFECKDNSSSLATVDYGKKITCILKHKNIYGIQCHPEKSHYNGETILKNFSNL